MPVFRVTVQNLRSGVTEVLHLDGADKDAVIAVARARYDALFPVATVYLARPDESRELFTLHPDDLQVGDVYYGYRIDRLDHAGDHVVVTLDNGDSEVLRRDWELHRPHGGER